MQFVQLDTEPVVQGRTEFIRSEPGWLTVDAVRDIPFAGCTYVPAKCVENRSE